MHHTSPNTSPFTTYLIQHYSDAEPQYYPLQVAARSNKEENIIYVYCVIATAEGEIKTIVIKFDEPAIVTEIFTTTGQLDSTGNMPFSDARVFVNPGGEFISHMFLYNSKYSFDQEEFATVRSFFYISTDNMEFTCENFKTGHTEYHNLWIERIDQDRSP